MKKVILFASVLLFICATSKTAKEQSFDSRFEVSFKVPSNNKSFKTTNTQIVVNHEEQYSNFDAFKAKVKDHTVLRFDGKSVGNTFQWKSIKRVLV